MNVIFSCGVFPYAFSFARQIAACNIALPCLLWSKPKRPCLLAARLDDSLAFVPCFFQFLGNRIAYYTLLCCILQHACTPPCAGWKEGGDISCRNMKSRQLQGETAIGVRMNCRNGSYYRVQVIERSMRLLCMLHI